MIFSCSMCRMRNLFVPSGGKSFIEDMGCVVQIPKRIPPTLASSQLLLGTIWIFCEIQINKAPNREHWIFHFIRQSSVYKVAYKSTEIQVIFKSFFLVILGRKFQFTFCSELWLLLEKNSYLSLKIQTAEGVTQNKKRCKFQQISFLERSITTITIKYYNSVTITFI